MSRLPCGCCDPADPGVPELPSNDPGRDRLAWRIRRHPELFAAMTAAIGRTTLLRALTTREREDLTIALLDAWAAVLDVLTFYTERIANEGYLGTAVERRSLAELAAMVGYELQPGVAAEAALAFDLERAVGAPEAVTVPAGTQVQSLPGPDEQPVLFETLEDLHARAEWSAIPARPYDASRPVAGLSECVLAGRPTLQSGELLVVVAAGAASKGADAAADPSGVALVTVEAVEPLGEADAVVVRFTPALTDALGLHARLGPGSDDVTVHLPSTARPFGHNAPDWRTLPHEVRAEFGGPTPGGDWARLDMDHVGLPSAVRERLTKARAAGDAPAGERFARGKDEPRHGVRELHLEGDDLDVRVGDLLLLDDGAAPQRQLFGVEDLTVTSLTDFTLTRPVTKLTLSDDRSAFTDAVRTTVARLLGRPLTLAAFPRHEPFTDRHVPLARAVTPPADGRLVAARGRRARVRVDADAGVLLSPESGGGDVVVPAGAHLVVVQAPPPDDGSSTSAWIVEDADGRRGSITVDPSAVTWIAAADDGPETAELVTAGAPDDLRSATTDHLVLRTPLVAPYDPATLRIDANVTSATHGETTSEVVGGADASTPFFSAALRQSPLTYRATADGAASTLTVRVNGTTWDETPTLYGLPADAHRYTLRQIDEDTVVQFGDGRTGARPPSGQQHITAEYRIGSGRAGNVGAGRLSQLRSRPLGVKGVINPLAAEGGDDPESADRARRDAALRVRTLDRVVSVADYEDHAAAYPGVGRATATWLWDGERRIVHVTCTGPDGEPLPELTRERVSAALAAASDGLQPFVVVGHETVPFLVVARLSLAGQRDRDETLATAAASLTAAYAAHARPLGRPVPASEVIALLHRVPDVRGVDLLDFRPVSGGEQRVDEVVAAEAARVEDALVRPAQLAALDVDRIEVVA